MKRLVSSGIASALLSLPAVAHGQSMSGMNMPGMAMPMPAATAPKAKPAPKAATTRSARPERHVAPKAKPTTMPGMNMSGAMDTSGPKGEPKPAMAMPVGEAMPGGMSMPGMAMPGMATPAMTMTDSTLAGTALPAGNAAPPPLPTDRYADRQFPPAAIDAANRLVMHQQGGQQFYQVMFNLAEYQARQGHDGYRWDGEAWFGGDINRVELRTEGAGTFHEGADDAEVQALYSRAIGPYFNLQAGVRQDFEPSPRRTYATIGVEGLAPYMFQTEARLFVSTHGEVLGRLEAWYDQRVTQRLVLQPRVELNLSAQDTCERRIGTGLYDAELGLRLRYETTRQFAPYVGMSYEAATGRTADYARADGKDPSTTSFVAGVRFWF